MPILYRSATNYRLHHLTLLPDKLQLRHVSHSFKRDPVKHEMNSQITLQVVQFCSQAIPSTLYLRSEDIFFEGLLQRAANI